MSTKTKEIAIDWMVDLAHSIDGDIDYHILNGAQRSLWIIQQ